MAPAYPSVCRDRVLRRVHHIQHVGVRNFAAGQGLTLWYGSRLRTGERGRWHHRGMAGDRPGGRHPSQAGALVITVLTLVAGAAGAVARFLVDAEVRRRWS